MGADLPMLRDMRHPMQPIGDDGTGVIRFKGNAIVRYLLDEGPFDMNHLARQGARGLWPDGDYAQFTQLIGYSVSGWGELSSSPPGDVATADDIAERLLSGEALAPTCPQNHPAACIVSSGEGTSSCAWCDDIAKRDAAEIEALDATVAVSDRLAAELDEANALLALYSGGRAGVVPEGGWKAGPPYTLCVLALEHNGRPAAYVGETGRIEIADGAGGWTIHPGPRPILTAIAEAEAWLKSRETP